MSVSIDNHTIKEYLKEKFEDIEEDLVEYYDDFDKLRNSLEQKNLISDFLICNFFYTEEAAAFLLLKNIYEERNGHVLEKLNKESTIIKKEEIKIMPINKNSFNSKENSGKSVEIRDVELSNRFLFDKFHPESYFATTRNIPEMKLKMIEDGICFVPEDVNNFSIKGIYNLFKKDNSEIEIYFNRKISRRGEVKNDNFGEIIRANSTIKHEKFHYRELSLFDNDWYEASNWMNFFIKLGEFIELLESDISVFISYIDRTLPATLTALGIMDSYFNKIKKKMHTMHDLESEYTIGEEINFFDGSSWRKAIVEGKINHNEEFDPYLKIKVFHSKKEGVVTVSVPHNLWSEKIRSGGKVKSISGKSNKVKINDRISGVLEKRYSKEVIDSVRMKPNLHINLVGRRVDSKFRQIRESVQFSDSLGSFLITDYLYLDNDDETNYINVHMVSSESSNEVLRDSVSLFIGAKSVLDFPESKTNKNIFFVSRVREAHTLETDLLISQENEKSKLSKKERLLFIEELKEFMNKHNTFIPTGVELYAF